MPKTMPKTTFLISSFDRCLFKITVPDQRIINVLLGRRRVRPKYHSASSFVFMLEYKSSSCLYGEILLLARTRCKVCSGSWTY